MDLVRIRKEIEKMAKSHKKPELPPVRMEEFADCAGREFLDKAYCRLLGRMPSIEEKEELCERLYSGDASKWEILAGIASSEECARYGADASEVLSACKELQEKEAQGGKAAQIRRLSALLYYLVTHKRSWRRLERIREIWDREDEA